MTIKAIIFDVGGVLVRTEDRVPRTRLAAAFGRSYAELDDLVFGGESGRAAQLGRITADAHWAYVAGTLGLDAAGLTDFRQRFFEGDVLDRALVARIREWKTRYTTAVLSNMMDDLRSTIVDRWKIGEAFDHLVISAEAGVMKPDRAIYDLALDRCGVSPVEAVFIDDFPHNIDAARSAGMHGVWFQSRSQALADLERTLSSGS